MPKDFVSEIKKYPGKPVTLLVGDENGPTHTLEVTPAAAMDEQGNEIGRIGAAIGVDFPAHSGFLWPPKESGRGCEEDVGYRGDVCSNDRKDVHR